MSINWGQRKIVFGGQQTVCQTPPIGRYHLPYHVARRWPLVSLLSMGHCVGFSFLPAPLRQIGSIHFSANWKSRLTPTSYWPDLELVFQQWMFINFCHTPELAPSAFYVTRAHLILKPIRAPNEQTLVSKYRITCLNAHAALTSLTCVNVPQSQGSPPC